MPARTTVAGAGQRGLADVPYGTPGGLGEVAGQLLDQRRQHDADGHGDEREDPRVAAVARIAASVTPSRSAYDDGR